MDRRVERTSRGGGVKGEREWKMRKRIKRMVEAAVRWGKGMRGISQSGRKRSPRDVARGGANQLTALSIRVDQQPPHPPRHDQHVQRVQRRRRQQSRREVQRPRSSVLVRRENQTEGGLGVVREEVRGDDAS